MPLGGCTSASPEPTLGTNHTDAGGAPSPAGELAFQQEHDFGVILADAQTLRHGFTLHNPTDEPFRVLHGRALTPCCSGIETLPQRIPARGKASVPVYFRASHRSGPQSVRFVLDTDQGNHTTRVLTLRARFVPAWQVEPLGPSRTILSPGQGGKQIFRVSARHKGEQGRSLPAKLSASSPLAVSFNGRPTSSIGARGLTEVSREVEVTIPAGSTVGTRRGTIVFGWADGRTEELPISWEVQPILKVSPPALVLRAGSMPAEKKIAVWSDVQPFRVVNVKGSLIAVPVDLARLPGLRHELSAAAAPGRCRLAARA